MDLPWIDRRTIARMHRDGISAHYTLHSAAVGWIMWIGDKYLGVVAMRLFLPILVGALRLVAAPVAHSSDASDDQRTAPPTKWETRVTDAFFPDPRAVLVGPRPEALSSRTGKPKAAGGGLPANDVPSIAANTFAWSKLIAADTLQDEVKSLAPLLADDVKTQQGFLSGANKKSRRTLSLLAAIFAIVNEYDSEVKWKNQAVVSRDLFAKAGFNCKAATEQTFREAKSRSEDLAALLRGESPTPPADIEVKNQWGKISNLSPLMSRLEMAQRDRIAGGTSNAGQFKKNADKLNHESEIVAALAEVISRPGMDNAEDEHFRELAKSLQRSALDLREAVKNNNYDSARTAAGVMKKSCDNCHADFR